MKKALLFAFTIFVVMNMAQCGLAYYGLENIPYNIILQGNSIEEIVCQSALIFHGNGYWEDAEVNGVSDSENPPTIPCAEFIHADNEYRWRPIIDIDNGVITNWEKGFTAQVHYKVCDDGIYTVTDKDGNIIVKANHMITPRRAADVVNKGVDEKGNPITSVKIRTILTCRSHMGVCAKCYGANMATGQAVQVGEAIGIIAAQSIGEPGTQLTMRTFHTGGVAGNDITQGLPRVEEIFEARKPKGLAIIAEFGGKVQLRDNKKKREIIITNDETGESKAYLIPYGSRIKVLDDQVLEAGDELTEGSVNPHDILKIKGVRAVQDYMLREVQKVYRLQGVEINDKHIEIIVRQMLKKIIIDEPGDSDYLPGTQANLLEFEDTNEALIAEGKEPATGTQIMLGITKASLATDSFMSAASFQETTKVLTDAAIKSKVDPLVGLKENVLIGKLIPAGTGMKRYRSVKLDTEMEELDFFDDEEDDDYSDIDGVNTEAKVFDELDAEDDIVADEFNNSQPVGAGVSEDE